VGRKVGEAEGAVDELGDAVVLAVSVTVGRKNVLHVEAQCGGVAAGLLHTLHRVVGFLLGLMHCDRHALGMSPTCTPRR
jgi:hypothetical protein